MSRFVFVLVLLLTGTLGYTAEIDAEEIRKNDEQNLGPAFSMLFWTPAQQLASYRNIDRIFPTRLIEAGDQVFELKEDPQDFDDLSYTIDGASYDLDWYIRERRVAGLLVLRDDRILFERYSLGNDETSRWISFSIAKSVTSMLVGAAVRDGYIASVDEPITAYLPRLAGGSYDGASIRDVLQMASGVAWNEDYSDIASDVSLGGGLNGLQLFKYLGKLPRVAKPGERFNYNTGETNLVGALLRAAIGNNASTYLSLKIWQPFGMEADANWMLDPLGFGELGGCCISATLRDYGRLGLFAMRGGVLPNGTRVLPDNWMRDSTAPSSAEEGYGYLWWLNLDGSYSARGIFGQLIWIDPDSRTVIVTHSAWPAASREDLWRHRNALAGAITRHVESLPAP
jgi:CubicO group peptidase (beta-lactamase class C family)